MDQRTRFTDNVATAPYIKKTSAHIFFSRPRAKGAKSEMAKTSEREPYKTIGDRIINSSDKNSMHSVDEYHVNRVRNEKYIYIADYSYLVSTKSCDFAVMKTSVDEYFNFGLSKNSALTKLVDQQMIRVHELGIINNLNSRYQYAKETECPHTSLNRPGSVRMELHSMTGILLLIGVCLAISALVLIIELITHHAQTRHWFFWWS
ncbi:hypothetical protein CAPTEDRAFT_213552 [Capitella teleta]|uniref:Ionotropic glutamate receptor C-terminal domain-containing protein n=1 Tax=Capitella teleta TaxID=283909 RepID=R7VD38_CAPTE|nr:hypothetical protein CAPTEDRAFT_213552 [Capitella teleta]|eukprot:ELU16733.1 hypothetical protein CAPTEDRAFT_213552 [Capitella teleta]